MSKVSEERDSHISKIEKRLEKIEKKFTDDKNAKDNEINDKIKDLEDIIKKQTKKKVEQFNCAECDCTTTSRPGLKTHVKRKHTKFNQENFPKTC